MTSTPAHILEHVHELHTDALGIHGVIDVEASASGEVLRLLAEARPGAGAGPLHRHRFQEERFEVLDGEILGRIGRRRLRIGAGGTFVVPPDAPHTFSVLGDAPARFVTEFRPALRVAEFFAQLFWLVDHGRADERGRLDPLQAAVLARAFPREFFYLPAVPVAVQQAIARPLAALGRARGLTADPAGLAGAAVAPPQPGERRTPPRPVRAGWTAL